MKKYFLITILFVLLIPFTSCDNSTEPSEGVRIGAVCKDGSTTDATGQGACSHHGGVDHWIYR